MMLPMCSLLVCLELFSTNSFFTLRETFFVPYVWDVIICTLTSTTMEWSRSKIRIFPLNDDDDEEEESLPPNSVSINGVTDEGTDAYDNTPDVV